MSEVEYEPFGRDTWRDPFALYARLREEDPVHFSPSHGVWVLSRFEHVRAAALDSTVFSSARGISLQDEHEYLDLLPTIVMMDPPEHTKFRRLVSKGFTPRNVQKLEPALRAFVSECVARLAESGEGDLVAAVARPVPCFVVAEYLGVPEEDRAMFDGWTQAIVQGDASDQGITAVEALAELYGYFGELVERRRSHPGDDMISALTAVAPDGVGLRTEEILGYAFVMIAGGNDTTTGLIGGAVELLGDQRDQRQLLIDDPSLIGGAVEEFLRLTSPVQGLCRVTTRPVVVADREIPADSRVLLCYGAANRDAREFGPRAEELDVNRHIERLLSFSNGPHHCLGAHAARLQGRIVLEELLRSCPNFEVDSIAGSFADGAFVRRYESLPFDAGAASLRS